MDPSPQTDLPGAVLERSLRARSTPLLRLASSAPGDGAQVVAKLESLRPAGCVDDRLLSLWDGAALPPGDLHARLSSGSVLAAAAWARARGRTLRAWVHGAMTHEMAETLALWGAVCEQARSRAEAAARAGARAEAGAFLLPALDGPGAVEAARESLGAELVLDLEQARLEPFALVAPAGATAAFLGARSALRQRWPRLRGIALCAANGPALFPELPEREEAQAVFAAAAPGLDVEWAPIPERDAVRARAELARSQGLSASHAAAAAVALAAQLSRASLDARVAVALVTTIGEREFSLDDHPRLARHRDG